MPINVEYVFKSFGNINSFRFGTLLTSSVRNNLLGSFIISFSK